MTPAIPRRNREEVVRLGTEIYERRVRPRLTPADDDKFVAIDTVTEDYEISADDYTAVMSIHNRNSAAEVFLARVGHAAAHQLRGH